MEAFERLLAETFRDQQVLPFHIPLVDAFNLAAKRPTGPRLFAALFDLQLSYLYSCLDFLEVGGIWNELSRKGLHDGSILDSADKFRLKLETHRHLSSYVLRLRAVWDKVLGFLTLALAPDRYEFLVGHRSRRAAFRSIAAQIPNLPAGFARSVDIAIARLDDRFRTSEAHGTGVLRKWALAMLPAEEDPTLELLTHYNAMNEVMRSIAEFVRGLAKVDHEGDV